MINSFSDNLQLANALADWQVLTGDWHNLFVQLEKLEAVSAPDIQRESEGPGRI